MHKTLSFSRTRPHRRVRARVQASTHSFGGTAQQRTLDGMLYLEALKVKTPGQQTVLSVANTYGKVQELKTSNRSDSPGSASNANSVKSNQYTYDDETRLTQAKTDTGGLFGSETENFTLDAVGNRIAHSKVNGAWVYDANNRLTKRGSGACGSTGTTCYDWDEAGNLTQKTEAGKTTQYSYDTQNRLVEVKDTSNGQANLVAHYGYDPLDRRIWKEQYRTADGQALPQAQRTYYLYADEGLIAESMQAITLNADGSVSASSTPQITTQYGPRPDSEFTTGTLFVKTKNSNGQDSFVYLHHDHLQTPLQATDKAGNVVWAASYNAFGKASITTPAATADKPTITVNLRLPGQYLDEETGLHYNWHRYYDGEVGRYVTEDPIGLRGGVNRYGYALANPLKYTDPSGLDVFLCSQPAFGIPNNPLDHQWLKTDTAEAGMGGTRGNIPGNQSCDMPGDPVQVTDHTGRSKEKGASCAKVDGVDEKKVNEALRIGRPLGRWSPTNQCQSFARQTLIDAGWKQPRPPYVPNPLPPFGF